MTKMSNRSVVICLVENYRNIPTILKNEVTNFHYWIIVVSVIISISVTMVNGCFLFLVAIKKKFRNVINYLYVLLSISDLLHGLSNSSLVVVLIRKKWYTRCQVLTATVVIGYVLSLVSVTMLFAITIQVYIAVHKPFVYRSATHRSRMHVILLFVCVILITVPVVIRYLIHDGWLFYKVLVCIFGSIIFCSTIICQYRMYRYLYSNRTNNQSNNHKRALITAILVSTSLAICFIPSILIQIATPFLKDQDVVYRYVYPCTWIMALLNGVFNPLIYCSRSKKVKKQVIKIFCSCKM